MTENQKLCECGCGQVVKPGNRFICGHSSHVRMGENAANWQGGNITLMCQQCGNEYTVPPHKMKTSKFCSRSCKSKWMSNNLKGENNPSWKGKVILICQYCGDKYEVYQYKVESSKFCSQLCYNKWLSESGVGIGRTHSDESKMLMSKNRKGIKSKYKSRKCLKCSEEFIPTSGKQSHCKKHSPSLSGYCYLFNESLKDAHRRYFNYLCFMDNEPEENGNKLSDHHVNYDKRCGCDATQFCIFVPVKRVWNSTFNGSKDKNRWYWYSFLMNKIFIEHPNYFAYHIPVWGMSELEYNYSYVFEKTRRNILI